MINRSSKKSGCHIQLNFSNYFFSDFQLQPFFFINSEIDLFRLRLHLIEVIEKF